MYSQIKRIKNKAQNILLQWRQAYGDFNEFPGKRPPLSVDYMTKPKLASVCNYNRKKLDSEYQGQDEHICSIIKRPHRKNIVKKVRWMPEDKLTQVRCFRLTDAPDAKEPSKDEITTNRTVKSTNLPKHFQESRIKELRMEKLAMKELREKERQLHDLLHEMKPDIEWNLPLDLPLNTQEQTITEESKKQQQRESQTFAIYYAKEHQIPINPPELTTQNFTEPSDGQLFDIKLSKAFEEKRLKVSINDKPELLPEVVSNSSKTSDMALALNLIQACLKNGTEGNQWKKELPKNYKTVPCKVYHGPNGHCSKGEFCHFIHDPNFVGREIPSGLWRNSSFNTRIPGPAHNFGSMIQGAWGPNFYQRTGRPGVAFHQRSEPFTRLTQASKKSADFPHLRGDNRMN